MQGCEKATGQTTLWSARDRAASQRDGSVALLRVFVLSLEHSSTVFYLTKHIGTTEAMSQHVNYSKRPWPNQQPDLSSGMAGLQMALSTKTTSAEQGSMATGPPLKAKPNIPQKKSHVEELVRLRKELEEVMAARDQTAAERDAMADDLLQLQEEVEQKDQELRNMSRDMRELRAKAERPPVPSKRALDHGLPTSPGMRDANAKLEADLAQAQQEVRDLKASLADSKSALVNSKDLVADLKAALADSKSALVDSQTSVIDLKAALAHSESAVAASELSLATQNQQMPSSAARDQAGLGEAGRQTEATLGEAETHWHTQLSNEQKLRETAESNLRSVTERYETELKTTRQKYKQQKRRLEKAETELQEHSQRMDIDSGSPEEVARLRGLLDERNAAIEEQRRRVDQFRRMSERLTTQVKQATLAQRSAEQVEQGTRRQLEGMKAQVHASQMKNRGSVMPGAF